MEGWLHETGGVWRFLAGEMRRECRSDALLRSHDKDKIGRWKDYKLTRSFLAVLMWMESRASLFSCMCVKCERADDSTQRELKTSLRHA